MRKGHIIGGFVCTARELVFNSVNEGVIKELQAGKWLILIIGFIGSEQGFRKKSGSSIIQRPA